MKNKELELIRINKYLGGLNEINKLVISGSYDSFEIRKILSRHKLSLTLFTFATRAGIFTTLERGRYKSNFKVIEPYQVRHLFQMVSKYNIIYKNNSDLKKQKINNYEKIMPELNNYISEDEAIKCLKKLGYKILKPINKFKEI
jgi:hypothetical protein